MDAPRGHGFLPAMRWAWTHRHRPRALTTGTGEHMGTDTRAQTTGTGEHTGTDRRPALHLEPAGCHGELLRGSPQSSGLRLVRPADPHSLLTRSSVTSFSCYAWLEMGRPYPHSVPCTDEHGPGSVWRQRWDAERRVSLISVTVAPA